MSDDLFDSDLDGPFRRGRRGFLGLMIGTVIGSPFYAKHVFKPPQIVTPSFRFRTGLILPSGDIIQGSGIASSVATPNGHAVLFNDFLADREMTFVGAVLLDGRGRRVHEANFDSGRETLRADNTLKVTFTIADDPRVGHAW